MGEAQLAAIDIVKCLPEEKIGEVLLFLQFINQKLQDTLILETHEQAEINEIIKASDWITSVELQNQIDLLPQ